jgi:hypothetical protein
MIVFLASRANLQSKRLRDRIQNRFGDTFENVRRRRAEPREAGPYRVVADVTPRQFLGDGEYPATTARVEIGFRLQTGEPHEYYWFDWIEPDRSLLVGRHQDDTHDDLGPVHLQVNDGATPVAHDPAEFVDSHPLEVVERRLDSLPDAILAVEWEQGRPAGLDSAATGRDTVGCNQLNCARRTSGGTAMFGVDRRSDLHVSTADSMRRGQVRAWCFRKCRKQASVPNRTNMIFPNMIFSSTIIQSIFIVS